MTGALYVEQARGYLDRLVHSESRGAGDTENAIRRIAQRENLSFSTLWTLRYRPPKDIYASILFKLQSAHEAMCERQLRSLENELQKSRAAQTDPTYLRAAERVVRDEGGRAGA